MVKARQGKGKAVQMQGKAREEGRAKKRKGKGKVGKKQGKGKAGQRQGGVKARQGRERHVRAVRQRSPLRGSDHPYGTHFWPYGQNS